MSDHDGEHEFLNASDSESEGLEEAKQQCLNYFARMGAGMQTNVDSSLDDSDDEPPPRFLVPSRKRPAPQSPFSSPDCSYWSPGPSRIKETDSETLSGQRLDSDDFENECLGIFTKNQKTTDPANYCSNNLNSNGAINMLDMRAIANMEELACESQRRHYFIQKNNRKRMLNISTNWPNANTEYDSEAGDPFEHYTLDETPTKRGRGALMNFKMIADIESEIMEKDRNRQNESTSSISTNQKNPNVEYDSEDGEQNRPSTSAEPPTMRGRGALMDFKMKADMKSELMDKDTNRNIERTWTTWLNFLNAQYRTKSSEQQQPGTSEKAQSGATGSAKRGRGELANFQMRADIESELINTDKTKSNWQNPNTEYDSEDSEQTEPTTSAYPQSGAAGLLRRGRGTFMELKMKADIESEIMERYKNRVNKSKSNIFTNQQNPDEEYDSEDCELIESISEEPPTKRGRGTFNEFKMRADIENELVEKEKNRQNKRAWTNWLNILNGQYRRENNEHQKPSILLKFKMKADIENEVEEKHKTNSNRRNPNMEYNLEDCKQQEPSISEEPQPGATGSIKRGRGALMNFKMRADIESEEMEMNKTNSNWQNKGAEYDSEAYEQQENSISEEATGSAKRGREAFTNFQMRADIESELIEKDRNRQTERFSDPATKLASIFWNLENYSNRSCKENYSNPDSQHKALMVDVEYGPAPPSTVQDNQVDSISLNLNVCSNERNGSGSIHMLEMRTLENLEELTCETEPHNYSMKKNERKRRRMSTNCRNPEYDSEEPCISGGTPTKRGRGTFTKFKMRADIESELTEKNETKK